jgi:hypothetical protein
MIPSRQQDAGCCRRGTFAMALPLPLLAGAPKRCRFPAPPLQLTAIAAIAPPLLFLLPLHQHRQRCSSPPPPFLRAHCFTLMASFCTKPMLVSLKHLHLFQHLIVPAASILVADCCFFCVLSYAFLSPLDCLRKATVFVVLPCCFHPLPPLPSPSPLASVARQS